MTPEETKAAVAVMLAHANGAKVECRNRGDEWKDIWSDCPPRWNWTSQVYRIAPTPKLRPWKPEEVPLLAWLRWKGDRKGMSTLTGFNEAGIFYCSANIGLSFEDALKLFEHSTDGGKTWKACGVMEDAS
jgi:hypothetical protein